MSFNIKLMESGVKVFTGDIHRALNSLAKLCDTLRDVKNDPNATTADHVRANYIRIKAVGVQEALSKVYPGTLTPNVVDGMPLNEGAE